MGQVADEKPEPRPNPMPSSPPPGFAIPERSESLARWLRVFSVRRGADLT